MRLVLRPALLVAIVGGLVGQGCGGDGGGTGPGGYTGGIPTPAIQAISPSQLSAGERIQILGNNFCQAGECRTRVTFEGAYQAASGTNPVQLEVRDIEVVNQGTLAWTFAPNIPFSTRGEPGVYSGNVRVYNEAMDGQGGVPSEPLAVQLSVGPSIIIRQMGPLSGACAAGGVTDSVEGTSFLFEVEAVGLQPGTPGAPVMFGYTFLKENFQFEGRFGDRYATDPQGIIPQSGAVSMILQVQNGLTSVLGGNQLQNVSVIRQSVATGGSGSNSGSALFDWMLSIVPALNPGDAFALNAIKTAPISNPEADHYNAAIAVVAVDRNGTMARRSIPLTVWTPIETAYDGNTNAVQAFEPLPVSGCIPGTAPPATLTYNEQAAEERSRNLNTQLIAKPAAGVSLLGLNAQIEGELGIRLDESVSSSQLSGQSLSVQVLPGEFGVVYRQTIQIERRVAVREHGACGETTDLGHAIITDWRWSPEVAKKKQPSCPPYPASKLHAQSF